MTDSTGDPLNMSGYTASAQIRKTYSSSTASNLGTSIFPTGQVTLTLDDTQTTALESGRYVYDMNIHQWWWSNN